MLYIFAAPVAIRTVVACIGNSDVRTAGDPAKTLANVWLPARFLIAPLIVVTTLRQSRAYLFSTRYGALLVSSPPEKSLKTTGVPRTAIQQASKGWASPAAR
jgi:hypothetical protein